jgi:putative ABC transport system ATP-binding protein
VSASEHGSNGRPAGASVVAEALRRVHDGGRIVALDGVSFEVEAGGFVALTGPSGSGKTTLLSLLGLLDRPTSGRVLVDGEPLGYSDAERARYHSEVVGFVFQHSHLLGHLTAAANVELALMIGPHTRAERRRRALELLEEVGVPHRSAQLAAHLSGGERQRVAIARALANDPRLLLADEPTGALDTGSAERVLALIGHLRARRGTTLIVVTYDEVIAQRADRVLHLRDGRLTDERPALRTGEQLRP